MNVADVRASVGIGCSFLSMLLMNQALFPLFDSVFTYTRDISITFSAVALIAISVLAMWRPGTMGKGHALPVAFGSVAGFSAMVAGVCLELPVLMVVGACLAVACRGVAALVADLAAVTLPAERVPACVAAGMLGACLTDLAIAPLDRWVGAAASMVVLPMCVLALCSPVVSRLVSSVAGGDSAAELSVTRPASFLPLTSTIFMFQAVVLCVFGFALRFGEVDGSPSFNTAFSAAALLALLAWAVARHGRISLDNLANVVVLALVAGISLVAIHMAELARVSNTVLMVGSALFNAFMTCVLVSLARRNAVNALPIFGWMRGVGALGTTFGALVGTTCNGLVSSGDTVLVSYILFGIVLLFLAYVLFFLRPYSFHDQIESVEPLAVPAKVTPVEAAALGEEAFRSRCHRIAVERGLTPREEQTFEMLARGRNREYIENALSVSRNTVKAHVKHVYAKLDIHSHQELIDLVQESLD